MEISEYVYEVKHPIVQDRILTISGARITEIMTPLSSFLYFLNPKVVTSRIKYYRNVVKTSCEIMREK